MDFDSLFGDGELGGNLVRTGIAVVAAIIVYWIAARVGRKGIDRIAARGPETAERAGTLWIMIRRVILVVVVVTTALAVFAVWEISLTPFLAVGTVVGAAIGFGAQDVVKDILAGMFILIEDQFRVGDVVTIAGTSGSVEDIQFRVTKLRDLEGNAHFVPNGQITVASNYTSLYAQPVIDMGVAYATDVDHALEVMREELQALARDPEWADRIRDEVEILGVQSLDDSAVVLRGRMTTVADERWSVRREALRRLKKRFDAEGITIPFPQLTIHKGD